MKNKIQVYLAGSMFCEADRMYNAFLAEKIRERLGEDIDLYVPQENKSINDKTKCADSHDIFWGDYNRLQKCDIFIARIDGDIPPSGTSAEIGIMSQRRQYWEQNKTTEFPPMILGLCTDSRNPKRTYLDAKNELMKNEDYESQYCYFNLFTLGCIKVNGELATSVDDLVDKLEAAVKMRLSGKREVYRRLAYEDLDICTMTNYRVYEIKYADGSSEMIKKEVKDER